MALIGTARLVDEGEQPESRTSWTGKEYTRTLYTKVYECECTAGTALQNLGSPGGSYVVKDRTTRVKRYSFAVMRCVWEYSGSWVEVV